MCLTNICSQVAFVQNLIIHTLNNKSSIASFKNHFCWLSLGKVFWKSLLLLHCFLVHFYYKGGNLYFHYGPECKSLQKKKITQGHFTYLVQEGIFIIYTSGTHLHYSLAMDDSVSYPYAFSLYINTEISLKFVRQRGLAQVVWQNPACALSKWDTSNTRNSST